MRTAFPSTDELERFVGQVEEVVVQGIDDARAWLASEQGRRSRAIVAQGLILAAPLLLRHPFFKTPLGRVVEVAGGVGLVKEVAGMIRDWEPGISEG